MNRTDALADIDERIRKLRRAQAAAGRYNWRQTFIDDEINIWTDARHLVFQLDSLD